MSGTLTEREREREGRLTAAAARRYDVARRALLRPDTLKALQDCACVLFNRCVRQHGLSYAVQDHPAEANLGVLRAWFLLTHFSGEMLVRARRKSDTIEWVQGDVLALPYADGSFDAAERKVVSDAAHAVGIAPSEFDL